MSGDNYTVCPACTIKATTEKKNLENKISKSYGKVSQKKYRELVEKLKNFPAPEKQPADLREDYSIGIHDGVFEIDYSAWCPVCGFQFSFKHKEKVEEVK